MPLVRMIISCRRADQLPEDSIVNTLYFNVSGSVDAPNYQALVDDLWTIWKGQQWTALQNVEVRAYNMEDAKPRPIKAQKLGPSQFQGGYPAVPAQVALCLSYYGDRNLPSLRGRIYVGPWAAPAAPRPSDIQIGYLTTLAGQLSGLGGLNVDWSIYSKKNNDHHAIKGGWVDDSWDIIRGRQLAKTKRVTYTANG